MARKSGANVCNRSNPAGSAKRLSDRRLGPASDGQSAPRPPAAPDAAGKPLPLHKARLPLHRRGRGTAVTFPAGSHTGLARRLCMAVASPRPFSVPVPHRPVSHRPVAHRANRRASLRVAVLRATRTAAPPSNRTSPRGCRSKTHWPPPLRRSRRCAGARPDGRSPRPR